MDFPGGIMGIEKSDLEAFRCKFFFWFNFQPTQKKLHRIDIKKCKIIVDRQNLIVYNAIAKFNCAQSNFRNRCGAKVELNI